jgi:hypothetical protein
MRLASPAFVALMAAAAVLPALPVHAQQPPPPTQTPPPPTTPPEPAPQPRPSPRFYIGPELGLYFPTDSKAKDAFGDSIFSYGIGLGAITRASEKGAFGVDFRLIAGRGSSNGRLFMAPLGAAYARSIGNPQTQTTIPYYGVSVNVIPNHIESDKYDVSPKLRWAGGGSVFVGTTFAERAYVSARYNLISKIEGFNLSGFSLNTGYRF